MSEQIREGGEERRTGRHDSFCFNNDTECARFNEGLSQFYLVGDHGDVAEGPAVALLQGNSDEECGAISGEGRLLILVEGEGNMKQLCKTAAAEQVSQKEKRYLDRGSFIYKLSFYLNLFAK